MSSGRFGRTRSNLQSFLGYDRVHILRLLPCIPRHCIGNSEPNAASFMAAGLKRMAASNGSKAPSSRSAGNLRLPCTWSRDTWAYAGIWSAISTTATSIAPHGPLDEWTHSSPG